MITQAPLTPLLSQASNHADVGQVKCKCFLFICESINKVFIFLIQQTYLVSLSTPMMTSELVSIHSYQTSFMSFLKVNLLVNMFCTYKYLDDFLNSLIIIMITQVPLTPLLSQVSNHADVGQVKCKRFHVLNKLTFLLVLQS